MMLGLLAGLASRPARALEGDSMLVPPLLVPGDNMIVSPLPELPGGVGYVDPRPSSPSGSGPRNPPECGTPDDCDFVLGSVRTTGMNCPPTVYRRDGSIKSRAVPCNTTTFAWRCETCGRSWDERA